MSDQAKNMLSQQLNGLSDLVERNPIYIPVNEVAAFLHVKADGLRASMESGQMSVWVQLEAWETSVVIKIPTLAFYNWIMGAALAL